ncbi:hypothetical protein MP638_006935, partial [Amoeboaphelidium occidentale]
DAEEIQEVLDIITNYDLEHDLIPSISKCAVIIGDNMTHRDMVNCHRLKFHNETLPVVTSYKYVGLEFGNQGCDILSFFTRTTQRASIVLNALKGAGINWGINERSMMFKTFALPIPMYGAVILYLMLLTDRENSDVRQSLELLDHFINEGVRWILSSSVANKSERALLGLVPTEDWLRFITINFKQKLVETKSNAPIVLAFRNIARQTPGQTIKALQQLEMPDTSNSSLKAAINREKRNIYTKVGKLNEYVKSRTETGVCKTFLLKGRDNRDYVLFRL